MAKNQSASEFSRDLSRYEPKSPDTLKRVYDDWSQLGKKFRAEGISDLDRALQAGVQEIMYYSSMAKDKTGQDVYAWITRDQAKVLGQVFQNKTLDVFELQYTTWEPGAFSEFLNEIKSAKSTVRNFVLSCHTGDEFTREQGSYLGELVPAWGVEKLEIHNNEFLPEGLDELAKKLEQFGYKKIKDIKLKGHRTIGNQREKGPVHPKLKDLCQRNKSAG